MQSMNDRPANNGVDDKWANLQSQDAEILGDEDAMQEPYTALDDFSEDDETDCSTDTDGNPLSGQDDDDLLPADTVGDDDLMQDEEDIEDDLAYGDGTSGVESDVDARVRRDVTCPMTGYNDVTPRRTRTEDDSALS